MKYKILIVSDSHNDYGMLDKIIRKEYPFHYLIHCGDGAGDLFHVSLPEGLKIIPVSGNVDLNRGFDIERIEFIEVLNWKLLITHGDIFKVQDHFEMLIKKGVETGSHAVIFGHTHKKYYKKGSPSLFNPGPANKGSYGILLIGEALEFSHAMIPNIIC